MYCNVARMGKLNSRAKGARFEREVARILNDHGWVARRGQQFSGSPDSPDVVAPDFPWQIEAKAVEKLNLYNAFTQAIKDSKGSNKMPAVVHKKNHSEPLITMRFHELLRFLERIQDLVRDDQMARRLPLGPGDSPREDK